MTGTCTCAFCTERDKLAAYITQRMDDGADPEVLAVVISGAVMVSKEGDTRQPTGTVH